MNQNANAILREWIGEHIVALGLQGVDPGDRELIAKRRSQELLEFAKDRRIRSALEEIAKPYGGLLPYVRALQKSAEFEASHPGL